MIVSTTDLHELSRCPKRWLHTPHNPDRHPISDLLRRAVLSRSLGRKSSWNFRGIANIWDDAFWTGKDFTRENADASVRGLLTAKRIYDKYLDADFQAYPVKLLSASFSSSTILTSSGDFLLSFEDRFEIWIHGRMKLQELMCSPLLAGEHLLLQRQVRPMWQKPLRIMMYRESDQGTRPSITTTYASGSQADNEKIALHLCHLAERRVEMTVRGPWCNDCEVPCAL